MYYTGIVDNDICNGPGIRISLFVSGCCNNCPGCFNTGTHSFKAGKEFTDIDEKQLFDLLSKSYISGFSILGGEPMEPENQKVVSHLIKEFKNKFPDKNIWLYTGYYLDKDIIPDGGKRHIAGITNGILINMNGNYIVDGPYIERLKDPMLSYRGSSNQHIYYISTNKNGEIQYEDKSNIFDEMKK